MTDLRLSVGADALGMTCDPLFLHRWQRLMQDCPWATSFQSPAFVTTWYDCYARMYDRVLLTAQSSEGSLTGLLCLACSRIDGSLHVAGTHHAEYQAWISRPEDSSGFIEPGLDLIMERFPAVSQLRFLFVPPQMVVNWSDRWASRVYWKPIQRGLMSTSSVERLEESFGKSGNRSRIKRLERLGPVGFERIADLVAFDQALDEIITLCNFRQGAAHDRLPFHTDPIKREFYLALMQRGLLHVTVTRLSGKVIAAHVGGITGCREVHLGIIVHSPFLARHSPGKLHLLRLGMMLHEEGLAQLDLTPGGEYKERFADQYDSAAALTVFFRRTNALAFNFKRKVIEVGKHFLPMPHVQAAVTRVQARLQYPIFPTQLVRRVRMFIWADEELCLYALPADAITGQPEPFMRRDCLSDLILYEPTSAWQPLRQDFLKEADRRLSTQQHVYTWVCGGVLAHYGWFIQKESQASLGESFDLPSNAALVYDYYTHPRYQGSELFQRSLEQIVWEAAQIPDTEQIYISVFRSDAASKQVIEKVGFIYQRSRFKRRRFGRLQAMD